MRIVCNNPIVSVVCHYHHSNTNVAGSLIVCGIYKYSIINDVDNDF